jgi:hypothetical protein
VTGADADSAKAAALKETGGGKAGDVEADDEGAAYVVEVTKTDGSVVDVRLDDKFAVIGVEKANAGDQSGDQSETEDAAAAAK